MPKPSRGESQPPKLPGEKVFQTIAEGLKGNRAYLLVFGICVTCVVLFGATAFATPTDAQAKFAFIAFCVLVALVLAVIMIMERGRRGSARGAESSAALARFRKQIIGDWWEEITFINKGGKTKEPSGEMSSISHVRIEPDDTTGHITMRAIGYNRQGEPAADWDSDVALIKGDKIFYFWNGRHTSEENTDEREGFGQFTFMGDSAKGKFVDLDVGLRDVSSAETKIVGLVRCSPDDIAVLNSHDAARISSLVESQLSKRKTSKAIGA